MSTVRPEEQRLRVGARIREMRKRQQLTQAELAARAGLSPKFLGEVERGANLTLDALVVIAGALGASVSALFEDKPGRFISPEMQRMVENAVGTLCRVFPPPKSRKSRP